jgi:hypothetical protein
MKPILLFTLLFAGSALAHEGHDHSGPASVKPKIAGAQIKGNEGTYIEVTYAAKQIKIFPFTKAQTPIEPSQLKLEATVEFPRKKPESVTLKAEKDHYLIDFDSKNAHRFTLAIKLGGPHFDVLKYTFEPKK